MKFKIGDAGNGVATIQFALNNLTSFGTPLKTDGIFGVKTHERVRQHQRAQNLSPDGVVGPLTLDSLFDVVEMSAKTTFKQNDLGRSTPQFNLNQRAPQPQLTIPNGSFIPPFHGQQAPAADTSFIPRFGPQNSGGGLIPPLRPPSSGLTLPNLQSPAVAEFLRHQQAFWKWFAEPHPKPALPQPNLVVVPTPGPFGPVFLPMAQQVVQVPGPPAKTAQVNLKAQPEGGSFSIVIKGDATFDLKKRKFKEATYGIGFDWLVLKGRIAKLELSPAVVKNNEGDMSIEVEATLKGGKDLSVTKKFGEIASVQWVPYLATAFTSEFAFQASAGNKVSLEINIPKILGVASKVEIGVAGFTKTSYGPVKQPDGGEVHQWTHMPFGGKGFAQFAAEF